MVGVLADALSSPYSTMLARSIRLRQIGAASAVAAGTGWYWSQQQSGTAAVASADAEMAPVDLVSSSVCKLSSRHGRPTLPA